MNTNPADPLHLPVTLPQGDFGSLDALVSTDHVVYDVDAEIVRATFDETRDLATVAVVSVLATVLGKDPSELPPLGSSVESRALEDIDGNSAPDRRARPNATFQYVGFDVTVTSGGTIEAVPTELGGDDESGD